MDNKKESITLFQFIVGVFFYLVGLSSVVIALGKERFFIAVIALVLSLVYIYFSIENMKGYILKLKNRIN